MIWWGHTLTSCRTEVSVYMPQWKKYVSVVELYTELFYAEIPALLPCFLLFCYLYISLHFYLLLLVIVELKHW